MSEMPLMYEHGCLLEAKNLVRRLYDGLDDVADERTRRDLTLTLGSLADQITDAECGLQRHLGLPDPEDA